MNEPILVFDGGHLRVYSAPARYILVMKLVSARGIDQRDIPALLRADPPRSREELYLWVEDAYPSRLIPAAG